MVDGVRPLVSLVPYSLIQVPLFFFLGFISQGSDREMWGYLCS